MHHCDGQGMFGETAKLVAGFLGSLDYLYKHTFTTTTGETYLNINARAPE